MKRAVLILSIFSLVIACGATAAHAQFGRGWFDRNFDNQGVRNAGHLWGNGYHVCNPGPDSSYYNPWSAHNTPSIYRGSQEFGWAPGEPTFETPQNFVQPDANAEPLKNSYLPRQKYGADFFRNFKIQASPAKTRIRSNSSNTWSNR